MVARGIARDALALADALDRVPDVAADVVAAALDDLAAELRRRADDLAPGRRSAWTGVVAPGRQGAAAGQARPLILALEREAIRQASTVERLPYAEPPPYPPASDGRQLSLLRADVSHVAARLPNRTR